jgi:hypothetical protein
MLLKVRAQARRMVLMFQKLLFILDAREIRQIGPFSNFPQKQDKTELGTQLGCARAYGASNYCYLQTIFIVFSAY